MGRRGYPAEFRRRVVEVVEAGRRVRGVATDLAISEQTIYVWRRQDRIDRGLEPGLSSAEHAELVTARDGCMRNSLWAGGIVVGHQSVEMLMQRAGLQGVAGRPRQRHLSNVATATDLVDRQFQRTEPDRLCVTDITEHPTREGKVYCAVVLDVFSRRVVG
jgi:hypothetical protein